LDHNKTPITVDSVFAGCQSVVLVSFL